MDNSSPMLKLDFKTRDAGAKAPLSVGMIPAVFYGPKEQSTPIEIKGIDFMKVFREAGESSIVTLEGNGESHDALVHALEKDAVSGAVKHVDFYVIEKGKKVQVHTPINFIGEAPAVKMLGGNLTKVMHEIEIEALPKDLPHEINVDISTLVDFDSQIHASDVKMPEGVTLITEAEEVVALVSAPKEEEAAEETPVDVANIELSVEKGKKEEEETPASE